MENHWTFIHDKKKSYYVLLRFSQLINKISVNFLNWLYWQRIDLNPEEDPYRVENQYYKSIVIVVDWTLNLISERVNWIDSYFPATAWILMDEQAGFACIHSGPLQSCFGTVNGALSDAVWWLFGFWEGAALCFSWQSAPSALNERPFGWVSGANWF